MRNRSFVWWAAPLVGAAVGGRIGQTAAREQGGEVTVEPIVVGALLGLLAGLLVGLADLPTRSDAGSAKATFAGRFVALLGLLLFWVPFLGLLFSLWAVFVNPKGAGWSRLVTLVGLSLSGLVSGLMTFALINEAIHRKAP